MAECLGTEEQRLDTPYPPAPFTRAAQSHSAGGLVANGYHRSGDLVRTRRPKKSRVVQHQPVARHVILIVAEFSAETVRRVKALPPFVP
jgi:hypothetical protein